MRRENIMVDLLVYQSLQVNIYFFYQELIFTVCWQEGIPVEKDPKYMQSHVMNENFAGYYNSLAGSNIYYACPAGSYSSLGSSSCTLCAARLTSNAVSTTCTSCTTAWLAGAAVCNVGEWV